MYCFVFGTQAGNAKFCELLLQRGVATDATDSSDGRSPLHAAASSGNADITKLLLSHKANVSAGDKTGAQPLHLAAHSGHLDVVRLLLDHDASVSAQESDGETPLFRAVRKDRLEVVKALIAAGADVAATRKDGDRPLHVSCRNGSIECVRELLAAGADIGSTGKRGRSAVACAIESMSTGGDDDLFSMIFRSKSSSVDSKATAVLCLLLEQGASAQIAEVRAYPRHDFRLPKHSIC